MKLIKDNFEEEDMLCIYWILVESNYTISIREKRSVHTSIKPECPTILSKQL